MGTLLQNFVLALAARSRVNLRTRPLFHPCRQGGFRAFAAAFGLLLFLQTGAQAERLRISPDDLRLRVAVSEELAASLRRELKDMARSTPLPVEGGLLQTERLLAEKFASREWSEEKLTLIRYYFLVARLDQSQEFSDEFLRRESLIREGSTFLREYIEHLNRLIARAVYTEAEEISVPAIQSFPLSFAEKTPEGGLRILHEYPPLELRLGRNNLRKLREMASSELEILSERLQVVRQAEKTFLAEVSLLGNELIRMRPQIRPLVTVPGEGLPFSR